MSREDPVELHVLYSLGSRQWREMLNLAELFGWKPMGKIKANESSVKWVSRYDECFKPTYDPQEWTYHKRLSDKDARNLASALLAAADALDSGKVSMLSGQKKSFVITENLSAEENIRSNLPASTRVREFANYAAGGGFMFAWDD